MPSGQRPRLNATAASLLGFLHEGPQSGWDLVATAERVIGDFWTLSRSQVYRELTAMAEAGFVKAADAGLRDRRAYHLTANGRAAFQSWLEQPPAEEQIRYPLLLTLAFARHLPPERLAAFIAHHHGIHTARLERYRRNHAYALAAGASCVAVSTSTGPTVTGWIPGIVATRLDPSGAKVA